MSRSARVGAVALATAVAAGLIAFYILSYLVLRPPAVQASGSAPHVHLTMQTVASLGFGGPMQSLGYMDGYLVVV